MAGSKLFNEIMFALWGIGFIMWAWGRGTYYFRYRERSVVSAMKVESLPSATRLMRYGVLLGVIGGAVGLIGLLVSFVK